MIPRCLGRAFMLPALLALLVLPPALSTSAQEECGVELSVELVDEQERENLIHFRFQVEIEANASCSALTYDFLLEEMLPNHQTKTIRKPRRVELEDGSLSEIVEHTMTSDLTLLGYEVQLVECDCPAEESEASAG